MSSSIISSSTNSPPSPSITSNSLKQKKKPTSMKVNKLTTKLIKPQTPTPQNLKIYNISFIDQFKGPLNFAVILFYKSKPQTTTSLQESLSTILVDFYPLAGRYIKSDYSVDCSDHGVEFIEAEALGVELVDFVAKTDTDQLDALLPEPYFRLDEGADDPILSIQTTSFVCGGVAVAISVSHRVFDASSLSTFVAAWSAATNPNQTAGIITPTFDIPSLLPYKNLGHVPAPDQSSNPNNEFVLKRFCFKKENFTRLKHKTISQVRVVCAVIAKAMIGLDRAKHGRDRDFIISQPINMRERTIPPQPRNACGNFFLTSLTRRVAASDAKGFGVEELVDLIGDSIRKSIASYAEVMNPNRDGCEVIVSIVGNYVKEVFNSETNVIVFSDWSKFGFYEADFGWGRPVLTSVGPQRLPPMFSNTVVLMSDREGGGIEAWVVMNENDMCWFEQDEEIKLFTS